MGLLEKWKLLEATLANPETTEADAKVMLARMDDDRGEGNWSSVPRVAARMNLTRRAVQQSEKRLESLGLLKIEQGGGRGRTNQYEPNYPVGEEHYARTQERLQKEKAAAHAEQGHVTATKRRTPEPKKANAQAQKGERGGALTPPDTDYDPDLSPEDVRRSPAVAAHGRPQNGQQKKRQQRLPTEEDVSWLYKEGRYHEFGYGSYDSAKEDLRELYEAAGEKSYRKCIDEAKNKNYFGEVLRRHIHSRTEYFKNKYSH